ncbi:MAG: Na+/H+ antiporter NhaA [Gammaproteobacteria bacterium]
MNPTNHQPKQSTTVRRAIDEFLALESAGGILLVIAAALALICANSPLYDVYQQVLNTRVAVIFGALQLDKSLLHWVNDGMMAVFFMLVGLEIKREALEGELSSRDQIILPAVAAVGGLVVPALIYLAIVGDEGNARNGWAIPTATDIAFALGVLALLGSRAPLALKVLVTAIAIIDDIAAISIIAVFYSEDLSTTSLVLSLAVFAVMMFVNSRGVTRIAPYILLGVLMWIFMIKSGVHATLAGVLTALAIPLRVESDQQASPAKHLEHILHPWVAFGILPVFAFANAGVSFEGMELKALYDPIPLGIASGLFFGKQIGIFGLMWLMIVLGLAKRPAGLSWLHLYGGATICGVGFTMSLFIGGLAFEYGDFYYSAAVRLGVIEGSLAAALWGFFVLRYLCPDPAAGKDSVAQARPET